MQGDEGRPQAAEGERGRKSVEVTREGPLKRKRKNRCEGSSGARTRRREDSRPGHRAQ